MKIVRGGVGVLVALVAVWALAPAARTAGAIDHAPFMTGLGDPASLTKTLDAHLAAAQQRLDALVAAKAPRTIDNTLRLYDEAAYEVGRAMSPSIVVSNMHPDEAMQKAADAILVRARKIEAAKYANRDVYDALAAISTANADAATRYYIARELDLFRRNGVDKDQATRERLNDLNGKLAALMGDYRRNVRTTTRSVLVQSAADLEGLPPDFIAKHKPGPTGGLTLRTDEF